MSESFKDLFEQASKYGDVHFHQHNGTYQVSLNAGISTSGTTIAEDKGGWEPALVLAISAAKEKEEEEARQHIQKELERLFESNCLNAGLTYGTGDIRVKICGGVSDQQVAKVLATNNRFVPVRRPLATGRDGFWLVLSGGWIYDRRQTS